MGGIASGGAGTKTNGSQFFIAMDRAPSLDRKHTLFGKVVGKTIYNLVRLNEVEVDKHDRPVDPPRIIRAELTWDPFEDLEPRFTVPAPVSSSKGEEKHRREAIKNKRVLSFGGDDEEDDDEDDLKASTKNFGKARSAHDALSDPKLMKEAAYKDEQQSKRPAGDEASKKRAAPKAEEVAKPLKGLKAGATKAPATKSNRKEAASGSDADSASGKEQKESSNEDSSSDEEGGSSLAAKSQKRNEEIQRLKRHIACINRGDDPEPKKARPKSAWEELRAGFLTRAQKAATIPRDKKSRQNQAVEIVRDLKAWTGKVREAPLEKAFTEEKKDEEEEGTFASIYRGYAEEGDEEGDADWLSGGGLKFSGKEKAWKLEADRAKTTIEIFDPLAAKGNAEILEEDRKRRNAKLLPSMRRKKPLPESW